MNLIEALKQANGKPVRRKAWAGSRDDDAGLVCIGTDLKWTNGGPLATFSPTAILADDWYVVEPKSKIEEAIERELNGNINFDDWRVAMRRVVNLALDEAANVVGCPSSSGLEGKYRDEILALKLKE